MEFAQEPIFIWLSQYAYEPAMVYLLIIGMMVASSFGFPMPEEVTLISAGLLTFMANHPETFPPPYPGAEGVEVYTMAAVCFLSVFLSDLLIYALGKYFAGGAIRSKRVQTILSPQLLQKIERWVQRYGVWCIGVFRFTPGLRFPGHLSCGALNIPIHKFMLVDGLAALVSVPTQILLIAWYGETILNQLQRFKLVVLSVVGVVVAIYLLRKLWSWWTGKKAAKVESGQAEGPGESS